MATVEQMIEDNIGLVYSQLNRFELRQDPDAESIAYEALYKAAMTYDEKSTTKFSTYAVCIIANALRTLLRSRCKKKQLCVVSYNATTTTEEGEEEEFIDMLVGYESAEDGILRDELRSKVHKAINKVYRNLNSDTSKRILIVWYRSDFTATQKDIAAAVNLSQPAVSRTLSMIKYKLKQELEEYL